MTLALQGVNPHNGLWVEEQTGLLPLSLAPTSSSAAFFSPELRSVGGSLAAAA